MVGRQVSVGPIGGPALRITCAGKDHESGQVVIERTQTIGYPGPNCRIAAEAVAGVDVIAGRRVVDGLDLATAVEAHIVHPFLKMLPFCRDIRPAFARLKKIEGTLDKVALARGHGAFLFSASIELLQVALGQFGLGIESINMGRPAFHHEEDTTLCLGRVMHSLQGWALGLKQGGKRQRTKPPTQTIEGFAAGKVGNQVGFVDTHASGFI